MTFKGLFAKIALALLAVAVIVPLKIASANGGGAVVLDKTVGPYGVVVKASPSPPAVGIIHMTVILSDIENDQAPVRDAIVLVSAKIPGEEA
ncbi:MAG: hypothetical protein HW403_1219, partial [Dehalococcoidia bacterium]|nr:hypothetical protein [Dehalococcoidia bacterium]